MKPERLLLLLLFACLVFGLLYRLAPLLMDDRGLSSFFMTEDGYLMLTVSRNLALGNGLAVRDGEILTNGIQPLIGFVFAIPYMFTGGDKVTSLIGVTLISALIAVLAAWAIRNLARVMLPAEMQAPVWPLLVAGLWFVGPLQLAHSMNGLETGIYILFLTITMIYFARLVAQGRTYTLGEALIFGSLCGIVFLCRIDGSLFVTALFLVRFIQVQVSGQANFVGAVREALPAGIVSLIWAAPWLLYNKLWFGSIVPISGQSQSQAAAFAENAPLSPIKLFETMFPMLPLPNALDGNTTVMYACAGIVAVILAIFVVKTMLRGGTARVVVAAYTIYALMIVTYYSLFFGAPHFLSRYFAPLGPLLIIAALSLGHDILRLVLRQNARNALSVLGILALVVSVGLLTRLMLPGGKTHEHFQVVDWVAENVSPDVWVGAVQTGTLGYWHDRTINLDGKVNPDALAALLEFGHAQAYAAEDTEIEYLVDWAGLADWADSPVTVFTETFELIVVDPEQNLAVFQRRGSTG